MIAIMSDDRIDAFFAAAPVRRFQPGEAIFRRDDAARSAYWLEAGVVELSRTSADGARVALHRATGPCWLAEASLFAERFHCDGEAVSLCAVRVLPKRALLETFAASPALATDALRLLSGQLRDARARAELLTLKTVAERLDAWIACFGEKPEESPWSAVAAEIGVSPEALYRELARRRRPRAG